DASWIGRGLDPAGGIVSLAGDQHGVGARRHTGRPRVGRAAVGADIDGVGEPVAEVVVVGDIGDAGLGICCGIAKLARIGVVVEVVLGDLEDDVAIGVVLPLGLGQHVVAGDGAGITVAGVAAAVGDEVLGGPAGAVVLGLFDRAAGRGGLDRQPAGVAP